MNVRSCIKRYTSKEAEPTKSLTREAGLNTLGRNSAMVSCVSLCGATTELEIPRIHGFSNDWRSLSLRICHPCWVSIASPNLPLLTRSWYLLSYFAVSNQTNISKSCKEKTMVPSTPHEQLVHFCCSSSATTSTPGPIPSRAIFALLSAKLRNTRTLLGSS